MTEVQKKRIMDRETDGIYCQGCGKKLNPDKEDLSKIEYVKTKRGSYWFFHAACAGTVWKRKIAWGK